MVQTTGNVCWTTFNLYVSIGDLLTKICIVERVEYNVIEYTKLKHTQQIPILLLFWSRIPNFISSQDTSINLDDIFLWLEVTYTGITHASSSGLK